MAPSPKPTEIEIARETLRRLAMEKQPPTPDHYGEMYARVSGNPPAAPFPEKELKKLHQQLPRETPAQINFARAMGSAIIKRDWEALRQSLTELSMPPAEAAQRDWSSLIRNLLQQLETRHAGLTAARKKDALEHVLSASTSGDLLYPRLQALLNSWDKGAVEVGVMEPVVTEGATTGSAVVKNVAASPQPQSGLAEVREILAQLLDDTLALILGDDSDMLREVGEISAAVRAARNTEEWSGVVGRLKQFCYRAHFVAEDRVEIGQALVHLVQLIVDNINELIIDDVWLTGQIGIVRELVAQPLNLRRIDEVERLLKDVIVKQSSLKKNLREAKDRLTRMLASFVDRLTDFSETTGDYHDKIGRYVEKIGNTRDIAELTEVLDEVMRETRAIQVNTARSRDEIGVMQQRVREAEDEVMRLRDELSHASQLVRHDALTGALNRKGMDEALQREIAMRQRRDGSLSLALLDIDNFKKLNDALGHAAGDEALMYLTRIVRGIIRPQDTLARYGGEEFVILLPDTLATEAVAVMTRIQRGLTREFFMHNNEKVLITFSCGVVEIQPDEPADKALRRADAAMYLAKRGGKNRVIAA